MSEDEILEAASLVETVRRAEEVVEQMRRGLKVGADIFIDDESLMLTVARVEINREIAYRLLEETIRKAKAQLDDLSRKP